MLDYRALEEVETWSASNIVLSVILLVVVIAGLVWLIRRFLIS